jgi:DNA-binding response OmpR family regulator
MTVSYKTLIENTQNFSLLLVEDYAPLRNDMAELLEDFFSIVVTAVNGQEALEKYEAYYSENHQRFDMVISDIQMPVMDGVTLSESIRKIEPEQSIMILSAHTESDDLLRLLNLGISKFITKPIHHDELLETLYSESIKLNQTARMPYTVSNHVSIAEGYIWDTQKSFLLHGTEIIKLTRHELLLIKLFIDNEDKIFSNTEVMHYFYEEGIDVDEKNIRNLVFKLRKKLPKSCIESIYGLGYKFTRHFYKY